MNTFVTQDDLKRAKAEMQESIMHAMKEMVQRITQPKRKPVRAAVHACDSTTTKTPPSAETGPTEEDGPPDGGDDDPEEEPSFLVHYSLSGVEAKKVDAELRQLLRQPTLQTILDSLLTMKKEKKILLPIAAGKVYDELARLGMPTTLKGFSRKNFKNYYRYYYTAK